MNWTLAAQNRRPSSRCDWARGRHSVVSPYGLTAAIALLLAMPAAAQPKLEAPDASRPAAAGAPAPPAPAPGPPASAQPGQPQPPNNAAPPETAKEPPQPADKTEPAQPPLPPKKFFQLEPYDVITLDKTNDNKELKVLLLPLPDRRLPEQVKRVGKLKVRLFDDRADEYEAAWRNIEKIDFFVYQAGLTGLQDRPVAFYQNVEKWRVVPPVQQE